MIYVLDPEPQPIGHTPAADTPMLCGLGDPSMTARTGSNEPHPRALIEHLEARVLLAADPLFGAVGWIETASGIAPYFMRGSIATDGTLTGEQFFAGATAPTASGTPFISDILFNASNGFDVMYTNPADAFDTNLGAGFLASSGAGAGWFYGSMNDGSQTNFGLFVERPTTSSVSSLDGTWAIALLRIDTSAGNTVQTTSISYDGSLNLANGQGTILATTIGGQPPILESIALSTTANSGEFTSTTGEFWFTNSTNDVLIFGDAATAASGGIATIAIAVRADVNQTEAALIGNVYRILETNAGQSGGNLDSNSPTTTAILLNANNVVHFLDPDALDSGRGVATSLGTWSLDQSTVTVTNATGERLELRLALGGKALVPVLFNAANPLSRFGLGGLSAAITPTPLDIPVHDVRFDSSGTPLYYELDKTNDTWLVTDLFAKTGSAVNPATTIDGEVFLNPITNERSVIVTTNSELLLFSRDNLGVWTVRDLVSEISGAVPITSDATFYLLDPFGPGAPLSGDIAVVAGRTATGDLVTFRQTGQNLMNGSPAWEMTNITTSSLTPNGQATPRFVGQITSFTTSWGAQHIAGVDDLGNVVVTWTAPGLSQWFTSNLSGITGVRGFVGLTTSWVQDWGGLNIAAVRTTGEVMVHWWTPGLGGTWRVDNLSTIVGGIANIDGLGGLDAFIGSDGSAYVFANQGGISGEELVLFQWDFPTDTWTSIAVTAPIVSTQTRPTSGFTGIRDGDNLYLFGDATNGAEVVATLPTGMTAWSLTDLSSVATPI